MGNSVSQFDSPVTLANGKTVRGGDIAVHGGHNIASTPFNYTFFDNPYLILLENQNAFDRNRLFGHLSASYQFSPHFSAYIRTGMDNSDELRTFKRTFSSNRFKNGAYAEHNVFFREINNDFLRFLVKFSGF